MEYHSWFHHRLCAVDSTLNDSFDVILTRIRPIAYMLNYMKKSMSMLILGN